MNNSLPVKPYEKNELELEAPGSSRLVAPSSTTSRQERTNTAGHPQSPKRRTQQQQPQAQAADDNAWRRLEIFGLTKLKSSLQMATIFSTSWNTVYSFLCLKIHGRRHVRSSLFRTVIPNHLFPENIHHSKQNPNYRYADNAIRTTKYSLLTFLPKNLFEQFHRFANIYFVFIVILNWFPQIETFGKGLSTMPVLFVLTVTTVKDIYEDYRRYRSDKSINHSLCKVFSKPEKAFVEREWHRLMVGDIVRLNCNEIIPADLLLLKSSDSSGLCFVETSNLDGESNLKQRQVIASSQATGDFSPENFISTIECKAPSNQIYDFHGFLLHADGSRESVAANNLLLRGCEIRNTDFIQGIVVYAGHETKAMLNNSGPRYKRSNVERLMNWDVIWCVIILLILCFIGAIGHGIWLNSFHGSVTYVVPYIVQSTTSESKLEPEWQSFIVFWSYVIILQVMIPISLYVSIEIVKLGQVFFISQDRNLWYTVCANPATSKNKAPVVKRIQCRALNIPEELGQIQYVMCDKTGTLTENNMIFRRCTVAGVDYGSDDVNDLADQKDSEAFKKDHETSKDVRANLRLKDLLFQMWSESGGTTESSSIVDFFTNMALCNTVVVNPHAHSQHEQQKRQQMINVSSTILTYKKDHFGRKQSLDETRLTMTSSENGKLKSHMELHDRVSIQPSTTPLTSMDDKNAVFPINKCTIRVKLPKIILPYIETSHNNTAATAPPLVPIRRVSLSLPSLNAASLENSFSHEGKVSTPHRKLSNGNFSDSSMKSEPDLRKLNQSDENDHYRQIGRIQQKFKAANQQLSKLLHDLPPMMKSKLKLTFAQLNFKKWQLNDLNEKSSNYKNPFYEAESPDELALVYAAAAYGIRLISRRATRQATLEMPDGQLSEFKVLKTLSFDSQRKRMSVLVELPTTMFIKNKFGRGKIVLFVKGADSSINDILDERISQSESGQLLLQKVSQHTNFYASYGLRTLWFAKRDVPREEYELWSKNHENAEMSIDDRDDLLNQSALDIEKNLRLLGAAGIEDRLQEGVPECIEVLRQGGLKIWILTGDKIETAINIAYACKLFLYGMTLIQLCAANEADTTTLLEHHLANFFRRAPNDNLASHQIDDYPDIGLVVDGKTLSFCLSNANQDNFVEIVSKCTSVLCCRATPLQKATIVELVKQKLGGTTLAIGDGANDVSMIQCANVGVGISGQEGMQAVMASDFAMARFKFLQPLLFVHGHWCYSRVATLVLYFFYKNALFVITLFFFQIWNGFSAQVMIDLLYLMLYNLVFTSLSPLLLGIFDKDAPYHVLNDNPHLYKQGLNGRLYRSNSFWLNMLDALWQGLVVFFIPFLIFYETDVQIWSFGFFITSCLVIVNQLHLALQVESWTVPLALSIFLSIGAFYTFSLLYNGICRTCCSSDAPYYVAQNAMQRPDYWLCIILVTVVALFPRFILKIRVHPRKQHFFARKASSSGALRVK